jgi:hypothetical protein
MPAAASALLGSAARARGTIAVATTASRAQT